MVVVVGGGSGGGIVLLNCSCQTEQRLRVWVCGGWDRLCVEYVMIIHREWKPYGAERIGMQPKMESLMTGFMYPAENENDD